MAQPTPVSYTHLDVYKRQVFAGGFGDSYLRCAVLCMESGVGAGHAGTCYPCGIYLEPYLCLAGMEGRIGSGIIRRRLWSTFRMYS